MTGSWKLFNNSMGVTLLIQFGAYSLILFAAAVTSVSHKSFGTMLIAGVAAFTALILLLISYFVLFGLWTKQRFQYQYVDILAVGGGFALLVAKSYQMIESPTYYNSHRAIYLTAGICLHFLLYYSGVAVLVLNDTAVAGIWRLLAMASLVSILVGAWAMLPARVYF